MADFNQNQAVRGAAVSSVDLGLRKYMMRVFNLMALSLAVSGTVAYFAASTGIYGYLVATSPVLLLLLSFAPLGILFFLMFRVNVIQYSTLQTLFWAFILLEGFSLGHVCLIYTGESIVRAFMISAITFSACSLYGYTTKRDLSPFATFMLVAVIGLIVAMIVNMFLQSTAFHYGISAVGILVFAGITAWNVQSIKNTYLQINSQYGAAAAAPLLGRTAILGALSLYIAFLNIFLFMLHLFGGRR